MHEMMEQQQTSIVPPRPYGQIPVYRVDSDARELTPAELDKFKHLIPRDAPRQLPYSTNRADGILLRIRGSSTSRSRGSSQASVPNNSALTERLAQSLSSSTAQNPIAGPAVTPYAARSRNETLASNLTGLTARPSMETFDDRPTPMSGFRRSTYSGRVPSGETAATSRIWSGLQQNIGLLYFFNNIF